MIRKNRIVLAALLFTAALHMYGAEAALKRYGLFIGANDGGKSRVLLRYAESDARQLAAVIQRTGGLAAEDTILLGNPTKEEIKRGIRSIGASLAAGKSGARRDEFIFYYSGHSDEQGLLLGEERLDYTELKEQLKDVKADVHIAILDSCSSGAFTRLKGGTRRSPFLFDDSTKASGHAFLTSSSENEAAQESDEIGGSFFTHYLIAALSGAADASQDHRVSLNEAYAFASEETLARTEKTLAGPQHPSYDINLTGTGDLVLTDLREGVERISLDEALSGRLFIRDGQGKLVLEMSKTRGKPVSITLPPGRYTLTLDDGMNLKGSTIYLGPGSSTGLSGNDFRGIYREHAVVRGDLIHRNREENSDSFQGADLNLMSVRSGDMEGIQVGAVGTVTEGSMEGIQAGGIFNIVEGDFSGAQFGGIFNIVEGTAEGPQFGGVFNIVEGFMAGPQFGGVFNIVEGGMDGPQFAGVFNMVEGGLFSGIQVAGTFNSAEEVDGMQAGVVNIAGTIRGMQIGVVNISEEMDGVPIGLVNIAGNGLHHISAWYDQNSILNLGFQLGTNYYTFFTAAINPADPDALVAAGIGMGVEIPLGIFYLDTDIYAKLVSSGRGSFEENAAALFTGELLSPAQAVPIPSLRFTLGSGFGYHNGRKIRSGFFAGVDLSFHFPGYTPFSPEMMTGSPWNFTYSEGGEQASVYPTWFLGLRL